MHEIAIDTETTGLDSEGGDRIAEIGAVRLFNHIPTDDEPFHRYINPEKSMPPEAARVHGLTDEFLSDKPVFAEVADDFLEYIGDTPLVIHNADFDIRFLNMELGRIGRRPIGQDRIIDTLEIARRKFPGARNSLDGLCRRYGVGLEDRDKHGALIDSRLLAAVYLELVGGRQPGLVLASSLSHDGGAGGAGETSWTPPKRPNPLPSKLTDAEREAHAEFIRELGDGALWAALK